MKRSLRKRILMAVLVSSATLAQVIPSSCARPAFDQFLAVVDFCTILNCQGSTFFNLCDPDQPLLTDCP